MKKKWTRRKVLRTGLAGAAFVGSGALTGLGASLVQIAEAKQTPSGFRPGQREILGAVADEIIPAGGGMPGASEAGATDYLDRLAAGSPAIKRELAAALAAVERASRQRFRKGFPALSRPQRVAILTEIERRGSAHFATLRDYVYEAYYLQPAVWKLLGYDLYPYGAPVPALAPFDEAALARVRKMPKLYREVE